MPMGWAALIGLGLVSQPLLPSTHALTAVTSNAAGLNQSSERTPQARSGIIAGVVVNARREPVARATVHAFSAAATIRAGADRPPVLTATRVAVDGREVSATDGVELADGDHEVVVFVTPREVPQPAVDKTLSSAALVEQFKGEKVFWRQFPIAKEIVERRDASVLPSLAGWLSHEDRHVQGNVAFIFAGLDDLRGFQVITHILLDRSDRPEGQGIATAPSDGRYRAARQIATDRYYAAHLLGDLRSGRAVPILISLLNNPEVNSIIPWALAEIGERRAIGPLLDALDDDSPSMRVLAIYALETLKAKEALPRLNALLDDHRKSNFGAGVSVADAAKAAIAKLQ